MLFIRSNRQGCDFGTQVNLVPGIPAKHQAVASLTTKCERATVVFHMKGPRTRSATQQHSQLLLLLGTPSVAAASSLGIA